MPRPGTPGQSGSASTATTRRAWASCKSRHAIAAIWVAFFSRWQRYGQVPPWRPEGFRPAELDGRCAASPRLPADLPLSACSDIFAEDLSARLCSPAWLRSPDLRLLWAQGCTAATTARTTARTTKPAPHPPVNTRDRLRSTFLAGPRLHTNATLCCRLLRQQNPRLSRRPCPLPDPSVPGC